MPQRLGDRCQAMTFLLAAALLIASASAQQPKVGILDFRSRDGSRFLLVPTGGPPIVHWVILTAAGVLEDPPGLEGLSHAVARAALAGTMRLGSRDPERERAALAQLDHLHQEVDGLRAVGLPVPDQLAADLSAARSAAKTLADRQAFERALREAPAMSSRLSEVPGGTLFEITTSLRALPKVALLLHELRESTVLRGFHQRFEELRADWVRGAGRSASAALRHLVEVLALRGHAADRIDPSRHAPLSRATALFVFRRTHRPSRSLHVLTGGFAPGPVRKALESVFATTKLLEPQSHPTKVAPPHDQQIRYSEGAAGPSARPAQVALGFPLTGVTPEAALVLSDWLAGPDSALLHSLRGKDRPMPEVTAEVSFYGGAQPALLRLWITDPSAFAGAGSEGLLREVTDHLQELTQKGPAKEPFARSLRRVALRVAMQRTGPAALGRFLALRCGLAGVDPAAALHAGSLVSASSVGRLAKRQLAGAAHAAVTLGVSR